MGFSSMLREENDKDEVDENEDEESIAPSSLLEELPFSAGSPSKTNKAVRSRQENVYMARRFLIRRQQPKLHSMKSFQRMGWTTMLSTISWL